MSLKKSFCGKLVKISDIKSSRVSQNEDVLFKSTGKSFKQNESFSEINQNSKEFGLSNFRVRKPSAKKRGLTTPVGF